MVSFALADSVDESKGFECVEDAGDLCGSLLRFAAETGGEAFGEFSRAGIRVAADGWQELTYDRHLRGEFGRPGGKRLGIVDGGW